MKIAVIGSGGREHAIIKALAKSPKAEKIYALPGNGGMSGLAECVNIGAKDIPAIVQFAVANAIDYVVVAPDDPLVLGAVDALEAAGVPCFGPRGNAAVIEGSKSFAKGLMARHGIPTARYADFDDEKAASDYIDGLKEGKLPAELNIPEGFGVELNYNYTMKKVQDANGTVYDAVYLTPYDSDTQPFIVMTMAAKTFEYKADYEFNLIEDQRIPLDSPIQAQTLTFMVDFIKLKFTAIEYVDGLFGLD